MQDQEFTTDQISENTENTDAVFPSPETETLTNFNGSADTPEQETVTFQQTAENPTAEQFSVPVQTVSPVDAEDEELFSRYEIKTWEFTPRFYKIFAFSAIINILFLVGVAQTNILRTKACDSPLVGGFCQVLDTLYVGGKILSNDTEFAEKPYDPTEIKDADIVWVDKTGMEPPLTYPAGYFQISNPEMFQYDDLNQLDPNNQGIPGIVNTAPPMQTNPTTVNPVMPSPPAPINNGVFNRAQRVPKTKGNEVPKDLPDGIVIPGDSTTKDNNSDVAKNDPKKDDQTGSKQPNIKSESIMDFRPNKVPLKDLAKDVLQLRRDPKTNLDLSKNFTVVMNAVLTEDGKFDKKKSSYDTTKSTGDEQMRMLAQNAMEKIGDSQVFYYLKDLNIDKINFVLEQNDNEIRAIITANAPTKSRAQAISANFGILMNLADQNVKEDDKDLRTLLKGIKGKSEDNNFIITFNLDKETAQAMIKEQLDKAEKAQTEETQKPNGNAQTVNSKEKTGK